MSKYHSKKAFAFGAVLDSKKEARRWGELNLLLQAGEISDLQRQVKFVLIPAQREPDEIGKRGGHKRGRMIERECSYFADFVYTDKTGARVVEDTKGFKTPEYIIKRKLMLYVHGVRIKEV